MTSALRRRAERLRTVTRALACVLVAAFAWLTHPSLARAQAPSPAATPGLPDGFDATAPREPVLSLDRGAFRYACAQTAIYTDPSADIGGCYSAASPETLKNLLIVATTYRESVCKEPPLSPQAAATRRNEAARRRDDAARARDDAAARLEALKRIPAPAPTATAAAPPTPDPALTSAAETLELAEAALKRADEDLAQAEQSLKRAELAETSRVAVARAWEAVVFQATSPAGFERFLADPTRQEKCAALQRRLLNAQAGPTDATKKHDAAAAKLAPKQAHASDLMRKASTIVTGFTSGSGAVEQPGSPDAIAISLMTALGADSETTGANVVMTLNLASIFYPHPADHLQLPAPARNLFLRVTAPLEKTQGEAVTTPEGEDGAPEAPEVRRISAVLGTSLFDASDPRLDDHASCYQHAIEYLPQAQTLAGEEERRKERALYFDVCHKRAAYEQRLALRAGISLITAQDVDNPSTRPELYAGAVVYGPAPWLYLNLIYQGIVEPELIQVMGGGFSFAGNVGGAPSGVDAWGRVGLDTLFLASLRDATDQWDWEWRLVPTVKAKLGDCVTQFGVGPRISGSGETGVFASVSLTYDADHLIEPLLTAPAAR